jgi:esterase FrsA
MASVRFPVRFRRQVVDVPYQGGRAPVTVHVLSPAGAAPDAPVLLASGGVDTWKMSQHPILVALAEGLSAHVVGFDHPGAGETSMIPLRPDSHEIMAGLIAFARTLTTGRVGHVGISFGGYFSAGTGLRGDVDAAVVLGGPVRQAFGERNFGHMMSGMREIIGNAMGFTERPGLQQIIDRAAGFSLDHLLAGDRNCPMLVVNGDADRHVPIEDTTVFAGRRDTDIVVVPGGAHCAADHLDRVLGEIVSWLRAALRTAA